MPPWEEVPEEIPEEPPEEDFELLPLCVKEPVLELVVGVLSGLVELLPEGLLWLLGGSVVLVYVLAGEGLEELLRR